MTEEQLNTFLCGFSLFGVRSKDGRLTGYPGRLNGHLGKESMDDWPEEVTLCGHTYTLENVTKFAEGNEEAEYA